MNTHSPDKSQTNHNLQDQHPFQTMIKPTSAGQTNNELSPKY